MPSGAEALTQDRRSSTPDPDRWAPVRPWLLAAAFGVLLVSAVLGDQAVSTGMDGVSPLDRRLALAVSALGNSGYMFAGAALVAALAWWGRRSTRDGRFSVDLSRVSEHALRFFLVIAASGLAAQLLKHLIGRARPRVGLTAFSFHPFSASNTFASFPSGHATSAFAAVTALGLMTSRGRGPLLIVAMAVAASRVILREHYPSDVLGGAALGALVARGLKDADLSGAGLERLRAWLVAPFGPGWRSGSIGRSGHDLTVTVGHVLIRHRFWFSPALIAGLFAIAIPPADLFGSEVAEHVKDGCAILLALAGLTVRALVVGSGDGPSRALRLRMDGVYALCRHPLSGGNVLIFTGIFLMHGDVRVVLFGTGIYILSHHAIVRAEEADLLHAFGAAYRDYSCRVPRWIPGAVGLGQIARRLRFDPRRLLVSEYRVIGATIIALAAAEFYEEIEEPLVGGQIVDVVLLGALMIAVSVTIATVWLAGRKRLSSP